MKTKRFISLLCLTLALCATAQNDSTETKKKWYSLYGFIRTDFFAQSHKMESVVQELLPLYPTPASYNEYGEDINQTFSAGFYSMATRLGLKASCDNVLGTEKITGCVEADFTGGTTGASLFLRKAFVQMFWKKSDLIIGQTWHPLCTEKILPNTLSATAGAPYAPFSRIPQVRYTFHAVNKYDFIKFDLIGAIVYQASNASYGPDPSDGITQISSNKFQKDAVIPNVFLGGEYTIWRWILGFGLDYKALNPVKTYTNYQGQTKTNNHLLHTASAMIYGDYKADYFDMSAKVILGSNLNEHKLIGGYAVGYKAVTVDGVEGYVLDFAPYGTLSSYVNISVGKLYKCNLFGGYSMNLGPMYDLNKTYKFYGSGKSGNQVTKDIYRVGLTFTYNPKRWNIGIEAYYNSANWGTMSETGKIENTNRTNGIWINGAVIYNF